MKPTFTSIGTIALVAAALVGGTGAFFSDTESSTGNTFAAGVIDLMIDNESYYNGNKCAVDVNDFDQDQNVLEYVWQGQAGYPVPGTSCVTSFPQSNLDEGKVFFAFDDLKPDDEGEDTISIHAGSNNAYVCMDMTLTSNDDNSSNEPELLSGDAQDIPEDEWDGELAQNLQMFWWADDGDNVYEVGENDISGGVKQLNELAPQGGEFSLALADSLGNVWDETTDPIPGGETVYIAKAWCLGELTLNPVPAGEGVNPSVATGVTCDGTALGNELQTDGATLDIAFRSVQARHNTAFTCNTSLTLMKVVVNDDLGTAVASDWTLSADGPDENDFSGPGPVVNAPEDFEVVPGTYVLSESDGPETYTASAWSCEINGEPAVELEDGELVLEEGDTAICTITNDDPEQVACVEVEQFADEVVSVNQGRLKNGGLVSVPRSDTMKALFGPQSTGTEYDDTTNPLILNGFFSLGFPSAPGETNSGTSDGSASIVLSFNNSAIVNGAGADLKLWEVTGGTNYPDEQVNVFVSNTLLDEDWVQVGFGVTRDAEIDIAPVTSATYVRIDDASDINLFEPTADGFDLDAVQAINCIVPQLID